MTRARTLSKLGSSPAVLSAGAVVSGITTIDASGLNITGVATATSFSGDGSSLSGVGVPGVSTTGHSVFNTIKASGITTISATTSSTSTTTGALIVSGGVGIAKSLFVGEGVSVAGTITYDDVTNIDSVGIVTAGKGFRATTGGLIVTAGVSTLAGTIVAGITTIDASGVNVTGVVTATSFSGDGSELSGVVSGIEVKSSGSSVGTSLTALNFSGATITTGSAGITTITIAAAGLSTSAYAVPTAGLTTYLKLSDAQEHKLTASGITTVTCYGGTEGESHTLRIVNSGVSTVGFSTYFLWPSGSAPSIPTADGTLSLISFTVQRVGTAGTQLLAGASLNFSY